MSPKGRRQNRSPSNVSLRRGRPTREEKPLILIVCEGTKTEPQYFGAIRTRYKLSTAQIEVDPAVSHTDPKGLVQYAKDVRKEKIACEGVYYDEVWCVFDRDEHPSVGNAFEEARPVKIRIAFSNPCFELWFLLHFVFQSGQLDRKAALKKLKEQCPKYTKSAEIYDVLQPRESEAIKHAERLRKSYADRGDDEKGNPWTNVDELVNRLNEIGKQGKNANRKCT